MRFETGPVSSIVNDPKIVEKAARFTTVLVRVPEAYELVRKHSAVRPGFLFLDREGKSLGAIGFPFGKGVEETVADVLRAMDEVLAGGTIEEVERGLVGIRYEVRNVEGTEDRVSVVLTGIVAGSAAAEAGLEPGDVVLGANGHKVYDRSLPEIQGMLAWWRALLEPGTELELIVSRGDRVLVFRFEAETRE